MKQEDSASDLSSPHSSNSSDYSGQQPQEQHQQYKKFPDYYSSSSLQPSASASSSATSSILQLTSASASHSASDSSSIKEKKYQCKVCGKYFRRDLPRHLRTHSEVSRFMCPFPRDQCTHKRGQFNRHYDFKKHLLHGHFIFDDQKTVRSFRDLRSKLNHYGACLCGRRFLAFNWLEDHVLGGQQRCPLLAVNNNNNNQPEASTSATFM